MTNRVELGGPGAAAAAPIFRAEGLEVEVLEGEAAARLEALDREGIKYVLVHVGPDDGEPGGSYARAHHRVESGQLPELARRLRSRDRVLLTCLAFAFKNGIPEGAAWVVDARFLDNPYWVPELKELDGRDDPVRDYVLQQASAGVLLGGLEELVRSLLPSYKERGRMELTIAFGCTGGRHRSVVLARELAARLADLEETDVIFEARDLS